MHIDVVPNRGSRPAYLLRESYRDGTHVRKRTLANLSALSDEQIMALRAILRGEPLRPVGELFEVLDSRAHGHVQAVSVAMQRLGFPQLLSARAQPERERVCAMVAARVLAPHTKLATTRWWHTTTLAEDFGVVESDENDLYAAMDWLLARQGGIEQKLAARHLSAGALALYDLSSSYFEGSQCPLAKLGYNRDGKRGKLQVNYGLLTDRRGCPVAVSVYEGNVADAATLMPQVLRLKQDFGLDQVVLVGDRGMIGQAAVQALRTYPGLAWITALKSSQIRALVQGEALQLGLFDERNLFELTHPDYPGERLVACRNPELGRARAHKRAALLEATRGELLRVTRKLPIKWRCISMAALWWRGGCVASASIFAPLHHLGPVPPVPAWRSIPPLVSRRNAVRVQNCPTKVAPKSGAGSKSSCSRDRRTSSRPAAPRP